SSSWEPSSRLWLLLRDGDLERAAGARDLVGFGDGDLFVQGQDALHVDGAPALGILERVELEAVALTELFQEVGGKVRVMEEDLLRAAVDGDHAEAAAF